MKDCSEPSHSLIFKIYDTNNTLNRFCGYRVYSIYLLPFIFFFSLVKPEEPETQHLFPLLFVLKRRKNIKNIF